MNPDYGLPINSKRSGRNNHFSASSALLNTSTSTFNKKTKSPLIMTKTNVNMEELIDKLLTIGQPGQSLTGTISESELTALCTAAREVFMAQPPFIEIDAPVKVP